MGALIDARSALAIGPPLALVVVTAIVGKIGGACIGARLASIQNPVLIGSLLIPRGGFSLILAKVGVDGGIAPGTLFPIAGFVIMVAALTEPVAGRIVQRRRPSGIPIASST